MVLKVLLLVKTSLPQKDTRNKQSGNTEATTLRLSHGSRCFCVNGLNQHLKHLSMEKAG